MMDISEAGTAADNISTSSASPTISNQAEIENVSSEKVDEITTVTKNMNSIDITTSKDSDSNILSLDTSLQHQAQKLTPVKNHPLMFSDDNDSEDSCKNFPDLVLSARTTQSQSTVSRADLVNSVNNNVEKSIRKPIYREPSPVCILFI